MNLIDAIFKGGALLIGSTGKAYLEGKNQGKIEAYERMKRHCDMEIKKLEKK